MKKGELILGTAAFLVTALSTLSFKMHNKYFGGRNLYASTKPNIFNKCTLSTCTTAVEQPTTQPEPCHALFGNHPIVFTRGNKTLWTTRTVGKTCKTIYKA